MKSERMKFHSDSCILEDQYNDERQIAHYYRLSEYGQSSFGLLRHSNASKAAAGEPCERLRITHEALPL